MQKNSLPLLTYLLRIIIITKIIGNTVTINPDLRPLSRKADTIEIDIINPREETIINRVNMGVEVVAVVDITINSKVNSN